MRMRIAEDEGEPHRGMGGPVKELDARRQHAHPSYDLHQRNGYHQKPSDLAS